MFFYVAFPTCSERGIHTCHIHGTDFCLTICIALINLFQRHNILTRPLNALRALLRYCSRSCFIAAPSLLAENVS
jgi:hypothetical protein